MSIHWKELSDWIPWIIGSWDRLLEDDLLLQTFDDGFALADMTVTYAHLQEPDYHSR